MELLSAFSAHTYTQRDISRRVREPRDVRIGSWKALEEELACTKSKLRYDVVVDKQSPELWS